MEASVLAAAIVLGVCVYVYGWLRVEQERTLQRLIERGLSADEILRSAGLIGRGEQDVRRGLLLMGVGVAWSIVTFFIGGTAWLFGVVPVTIGAVFLVFRVLGDRSR